MVKYPWTTIKKYRTIVDANVFVTSEECLKEHKRQFDNLIARDKNQGKAIESYKENRGEIVNFENYLYFILYFNF